MPSASLQSRIRAFEALSSSSSSSSSTTMATTAFPPSPSTPTPIPLTDPRASSPNLLESPISPTADAFRPIAPFVAPTSSSRSPSPSSPSRTITHKTSLIDLKDWIIDDGPLERPCTLRHTLNVIHESSRTPTPPGKPLPSDNVPNSSTPLINFESPPKSRPPLPPRKPPQLAADRAKTHRSISQGSDNGATLRPPGRSESLTIEHTYPPGAHKFGATRPGHAPASSISSFHSVSLSSDGSNTEVPSLDIGSKPPSFTFDVDTSSITDVDTASIAESFENVSASAISPSTAIHYDWEQAMGKQKTSLKLEPPRLPQRPTTKVPPALPPKPLARSVSASSSSTTTGLKTHRPPPPPLSPYQPRSRPSSSRASVVSTSASTSDRSSVISHATTTSLTSISTRNSTQPGNIVKPPPPLFRPAPVPPAARARYEDLFTMAVQGRRRAEKKKHKSKPVSPPRLAVKKSRQAAGWRGLSVDLITTPDQHPGLAAEKVHDETDSEDEESPVRPEEKLSGRIVKYIWSTSRLDRKKLRNIWDDCDPRSIGFIDRDAFVKGMWRIDEELRRAQLARRTSALSAASSQRMPHRPLPPPRPQGSPNPRLLI